MEEQEEEEEEEEEHDRFLLPFLSPLFLCVSPPSPLDDNDDNLLPPSLSLSLPLPPLPPLFDQNERAFPRFWPFCASRIGCAAT